MKIINDLKYKFYKKNDEKQIIKLFKKTFKKKLSLTHWKWVFKKNPAGNNKLLLTLYKKKIIAQCASIKLNYKLYSKSKNFFRIQNFMVDMSFRGKNIASNALKLLTLNIIKKKNYIITFPNKNSLNIFLRNGYRKFDLFTYEMTLENKISINENIIIKNSKFIHFSNEDSNLIKSFLKGFSLFNLRNKNYLIWRYSKKYNKYKISRIYKDKNLIGLAILKFYPKDKSINICELFYTKDHGALSAILYAVIINSKINKPKRIKLWSMPHYTFHKNLLRLGFKKTNFKTNVCTYKNLPRKLKVKNFYLSMGDSDIY